MPAASGPSVRPTRRSCVEEAFERFREYAKDVLADVPELRSVSLVADWAIGGSEFPPAAMFGRGGVALTSEELVGCMQQTLKLIAYQQEGLRHLTAAAVRAAGTKTEATTPDAGGKSEVKIADPTRPD